MDNRTIGLILETAPKYTRLRLIKRSESLFIRLLFAPLSFLLRKNYDSFATTIFSTVYLPTDWESMSDNSKYVLLRHEFEHVRQFHEWFLGRRFWFINHLLVAFAYIFVLPAFWTLRAKFEREAYTQTLLARHELGWLEPLTWHDVSKNFAKKFGTGVYFWMWNYDAAYRWTWAECQRIYGST
jgi:hypothetical protein